MKKILLTFLILGVILVFGVLIYQNTNKANNNGITVTQKQNSTSKGNTTSNQTSSYYHPMTNFNGRIKYRWFGKYVNANDVVPDCGAKFIGFHDAVDLEVTPEEKSQDVPVFAVSDGTVKLVSNISGYGGLLVLGANIKGEDVTLNYGHVRLSSVSLKVGDKVTAGQKLGVLGTGCSTETDGERKHLHFAIHKGTRIDVRGYVPNQGVLNEWIDPRSFLLGISANEPK